MEEQNTIETAEEKNDENISPKSKIATGVLALLLGHYGVDQFYLGKIGDGIKSIFITIGCLIAAFVIGFVVGFILGILTAGVGTVLAMPLGFICGACSWIWPIIRAVRAFKGKETDNKGRLIAN